MKFVHAADLHLDSPMKGLAAYPGAPVEAMRGATRQALESLVELCVEEDAELLVTAGDVYDGDWSRRAARASPQAGHHREASRSHRSR
jgi:exonuclease SbcD